jgi:cytochrome c biogenesis protein CcdA
MLPSVADVKHYARTTARRGVMFAAGGVLVAVGGAFLLAALWSFIAQHFGPVIASLGIGVLILGAGLVVMSMAPRQPTLPTPAQKLRVNASARPFKPTGQFPPVIEAFLFGISVALQVRNRRGR